MCQMSDHFKDIIYVYDPDSNQSFFINKPLFLVKVKDLFDNENISCYPVFIYLPDNAKPRKVKRTSDPQSQANQALKTAQYRSNPSHGGAPLSAKEPHDQPRFHSRSIFAIASESFYGNFNTSCRCAARLSYRLCSGIGKSNVISEWYSSCRISLSLSRKTTRGRG